MNIAKPKKNGAPTDSLPKWAAKRSKLLLQTEDLAALVVDLKDKLRKTKSMQARMKLAKRLKIVEGFATVDQQA